MLKRIIFTFAERVGKQDKYKDKYKHRDSTNYAEKETFNTFADRAYMETNTKTNRNNKSNTVTTTSSNTNTNTNTKTKTNTSGTAKA